MTHLASPNLNLVLSKFYAIVNFDPKKKAFMFVRNGVKFCQNAGVCLYVWGMIAGE